MDNKWLFPIRMENSKQIEWVDNIVVAIGKFKAPITQATWDNCLRRGVLRADTPEQTQLLRDWWTIGWKEIPTLPQSYGPNPTMQIANGTLGQTLETIYPTMTQAAEHLQCSTKTLKDIAQGICRNYLFDGEVRLMKQFAEKELPYPPWTLFAADNTIEGYFPNRFEMANYLGIHYKVIDKAHYNKWNRLKDGRWFWYERWGFFPISPQDEILTGNWREKYSPNYSPDKI